MLLMEAALTPDTLPPGTSFSLEVVREGQLTNIILSTRDGDFIRASRRQSQYYSQPCFDGFEVRLSTAKHGLGPLMYDIVMEVASEIGGGLYSDRSEVSGDARSIWDYYDANRPDVQKFVMDSPQNERTPELYDNCDIELVRSEMGQEEWWGDPLAKVYVKKGSHTIKRLMKLGKIEIAGWSPK